jgi:hypothetical protein
MIVNRVYRASTGTERVHTPLLAEAQEPLTSVSRTFPGEGNPIIERGWYSEN